MTQNNFSRLYLPSAPVWWDPEKSPKQVISTRDNLLEIMSPAAFKAKPRTGLLLYGPPGTGKTSAGIWILYEWAKSKRSSTFQDFGELMVAIRSAWRRDAKRTVEEIHEDLLNVKILMLDDIGKRAAPEDQETLSILVNGRLNRGLPTICTTNCDLTTKEGRAEFYAACDSRVLERYSGNDVGFKGKENLRRAHVAPQ
jgi:DNA replication protein DnaC